MFELYYIHPTNGEVLVAICSHVREFAYHPDQVDGCKVRYRYVE